MCEGQSCGGTEGILVSAEMALASNGALAAGETIHWLKKAVVLDPLAGPVQEADPIAPAAEDSALLLID